MLKPGGCYMLTCSAPPGLHTRLEIGSCCQVPIRSSLPLLGFFHRVSPVPFKKINPPGVFKTETTEISSAQISSVEHRIECHAI